MVLKGEKPVLIVEAYGERVQFHVCEKAEMIESLNKIIEAFNSGRIWSSNKRIRIKYINHEISTKCFISEELYKLGFEPEMMDIVYWKSV